MSDLLNTTRVSSKRNEQPFRSTKKLMSAIDALNVDGCYLNNFMTNIELISSEGASDTLLFSANLKNSSKTEVVLKISPSDANDNGTFVEILIYKQLINKLYVGRITPHIMPCLGTFSCNNFILSVPTYISKNWVRTIQDKWKRVVKNLQCSPYIANFLVLQMNDGMSLQNFITEEYDEEIFTTLFFQVCYTLHCFNKAGLRHNDLHLENVFVEMNSSVQEISYIVEQDIAFSVPTHGRIAKVFDFDRSYFAHGIKNTGLMDQTRNGGAYNLCTLVGTCNENNPVFDMYYFIRILMTEIPKGALYNSINTIIHKNAKRAATFARINPSKTLFLRADEGGEYDWRSDDLPTPLEFLQNLSAFDKFRVQHPLNPKMPNTFFSDETIRKSFHVRSRPLPARPIINNDYILKCIECEWPGELHAESSFSLKDVEGVMNWLISLSVNRDPRQVIAAFDEFLEFLQRYPVKDVDALKIMGGKFLAMHLHLDSNEIRKVFGKDSDKINMYPMLFDSKCQSTLEYLLYCENDFVPKSAQKRFKKYPDEVVKHVLGMYTDSQHYLVSPVVRAHTIMKQHFAQGSRA